MKFSLKLLFILTSFLYYSQSSYAGEILCGTQIQTHQSLDCISILNFKPYCYSYQQQVKGKWYLYIKSDNPAVTLGDLSFQRPAPYKDSSVIKKVNGLYRLPDLSGNGDMLNIDNAHVDINFNRLIGNDTTARLEFYVLYSGPLADDTIIIDNNGIPHHEAWFADEGVEFCFLTFSGCSPISEDPTVETDSTEYVEEDPTAETDSTEYIAEISTQITDKKNNPILTVYPNPTSSILYTSFNSSSFYKLTDASGALIKEGQTSNEGSINIQDIPNGLYIIQITNGEQIQTMKVIKN